MIKLLLVSLCVVSLRVSTTLSSQKVFDCGVSQIMINEVIVNGYNTVRGAWPWHVAVYQKYGTKEMYACGGTLVTEYHVITAAHCLKNPFNGKPLTIYEVFVRIGVYQLNATDSAIVRRMIRKIHRTDNFHIRQDLRNDIAILQLATKVEFGKHVQPACVSLADDLTGQVGTVIGWGIDESNKVSDVLKSAWLPVIDFHTCLASDRAMYGAILDEGVFCAGYTNGTAVCNGDSGGGLFFQENGAWHLGGVVSFSQFRNDRSRLCHSKGYSAFTKIHTYLAWIRLVTELKLPIEDQNNSTEPDENDYYANVLPRDCGISKIRGAVQQNDSDVFEFPWMAILRYENISETELKCVASLIHKRYVLTHAHCTYVYKPYQVRLGEHTIGQSRDCNGRSCAPPVRDYGVESITIRSHALDNDLSGYVPVTGKNMHSLLPIYLVHVANDVALIRLDRDVIFEDHIRPVCLPVTQSLRSHDPDQYVYTVWEFGPEHPPPMALMKVSAINNPLLCTRLKRQNVDMDGLVCIMNLHDRRVCRMSRGSPLISNVMYNGLRFVQFGVNLVVVDCKYVFSMSTVFHMDWILANIKP